MALIRVATAVLFIAVCVRWYIYRGSIGSVFVSQPNASYDYIVVGAGSAGSVVASRLSEDPDVTVLLVEAGGDDLGNTYISTPSLITLIQMFHPEVFSLYFTEPDKARYKGLNNGQSKWPRGKVLGGGSSINFMLHVRGSRHDYDRWADYTRDPTWNYNHVLPYFKRSEKMMTPELVQSVYHSREGLLGVTRSSVSSFISLKLMKGFQELGYPFNEDYNGEIMEGISAIQQTIESGERSSTSRAFLHRVLERANLHIALNSRVQKVTINNNRADGVELIKDGKKLLVRAKKEVIMSAGAIETSKILMLSGIGPKKHLEELNIPLVADLPVGDNMQDHAYYELSIEYNNEESPESSMTKALNILQYKLFRTGPMSMFDCELALFSSTAKENRDIDWPDIQLIFASRNFKIGTGYLRVVNIDEELIEDYSYRDNVTTAVVICPLVMRPTSRGSIKLRSIDPFDPPVIIPNYFETKEDVETMLKGIEIVQKVIGTKALLSAAAKLADTRPLRICSEYKVGSNEHWSCLIRARPLTVYHAVGTCKMGQANDSTAVVDPQLRVRYVAGLRVADGSIMPYITSGSTNAATIMIGEKVADFIRGRSLHPIYNF